MEEMSTKSIAIDVSTEYLSSIDRTVPHSSNIQSILHPVLLRTTRRILLGRADDAGEEDKNYGDGDGDSSTEVVVEDDDDAGNEEEEREDVVSKKKESSPPSPNITTTSTTTSVSDGNNGEDEDEDGGSPPTPTLSRRTLARMEAFLGGLSWAVPSDPIIERRGAPSSEPAPTAAEKTTKARLGEGEGGKNDDADGDVVQGGDEAVVATGQEGRQRQTPRQIAAALTNALPNALLSNLSFGRNSEKGVGSGDGGGGGPDGGNDDVVGRDTTTMTMGRQQRRNGRRRRTCRYYRQIDPDELVHRVDLYLRVLRRIRDWKKQREEGEEERTDDIMQQKKKKKGGAGTMAAVDHECTIQWETRKMLQKRVEFILQSFVGSVSCVSSIQPVLSGLVNCLTREVLAVECLGDQLVGAIQRLVAEYEMQTSFASIAFLSSPDQSAYTTLSPLLASYLQYLQRDWKHLVFDCELERMLKGCLPPEVRDTFKTMEFTSIGHLLRVCDDYGDALNRIELPPSSGGGGGAGPGRGRGNNHSNNNDNNLDGLAMGGGGGAFHVDDPRAVKQALRDLRRETITVNGNVLPPAHSVRQLVNHLAEALNGGTADNNVGGGGGGSSPNNNNDGGGGGRGRRHQKKKPSAAAETTTAWPSQMDCSEFLLPDSESSSSEAPYDTAEEDGTVPRRHQPRAAAADGAEVTTTPADDGYDGVAATVATTKKQTKVRTRRHFDIRTIDDMTLRLMNASCRTVTGGDAYFVVQDLFGGDDVVVVASTCSSPPTSTTTNRRGNNSGGGGGGGVRQRAGKKSSHNSRRRGTIEITVRLSSVDIEVHGTYNVFPRNIIDGDGEGGTEPLIQLHTSTKETISLRQVRRSVPLSLPEREEKKGLEVPNNGLVGPLVSSEGTTTKTTTTTTDDDDGSNGSSGDGTGGGETTEGSSLVLQERITESTGRRILSIRPAKYEKVEVWNTPS